METILKYKKLPQSDGNPQAYQIIEETKRSNIVNLSMIDSQIEVLQSRIEDLKKIKSDLQEL